MEDKFKFNVFNVFDTVIGNITALFGPEMLTYLFNKHFYGNYTP